MADLEYMPKSFGVEEWERPRALPLSAVFPQHHVYFIGADDGPVKIGYSVNPKARLRQLQTSAPAKLKILAQTAGSPELEREYHTRFAEHRLHGEWFARCAEIEAEICRLTGREPKKDYETGPYLLMRKILASMSPEMRIEQIATLREQGSDLCPRDPEREFAA